MFNKKKLIKILTFSSLLFISFSSFSPVAAFFTRYDFYFDVTITDAGYSDLDSDGIEDDIFVVADIDFWFDTKEYAIVDFIAYLDLYTPANNTWYYSAEYTYYKRDQTLTFYLPDSVDDEGWYIVYLEVYIIGEDGRAIYISANWDETTFDPPEVGNGTPPPGGTLFIN